MNRNDSIRKMTAAALLIAIGYLIPTFSPLKILLEPASFTLGSHIAIMIAMFISPSAAIAVTIGTTLGFLMSFPLVVALRAASHIVFATLGSIFLKKNPVILGSAVKTHIFNLLIACIHAICEVLVVIPFYFGNALPAGNYDKGFVTAVILLVGLGTVVHSLIDFTFSWLIYKGLIRIKTIRDLFLVPSTK